MKGSSSHIRTFNPFGLPFQCQLLKCYESKLSSFDLYAVWCWINYLLTYLRDSPKEEMGIETSETHSLSIENTSAPPSWLLTQCMKTSWTHCIYLVKSFPVFLRNVNWCNRLNRAPQKTRPDSQITEILVLDELCKSSFKLHRKHRKS